MNELWAKLAGEAHLELSDGMHQSLERFLAILADANTRMNLTRITDADAARVQHVADAMTLLPHLTGAKDVADVGSGGGVPGIPLAILLPQTKFTLIEATRKKAAFLQACAGELGLANVTVLPERVEDVGRGPLRERFDVAIARAVAEMVWLAEWCLPLVKVGGVVLAMKGEKAASELPAAADAIVACGGLRPQIHPANLPDTQHRVIVRIGKKSPTNPLYPRPATAAKNRPLTWKSQRKR